MGWVALSLACHVWAEAPASKAVLRIPCQAACKGPNCWNVTMLLKAAYQWSWRKEFACGLAQGAEQSEEQYLHFTQQQNHPDLTVLILLFLFFTAGTLQADFNAKDTKMWFGAQYRIPREEDQNS